MVSLETVLSDAELPKKVITPEGKIGTVIDNEKIFEVDTIKDFKTKGGKRYFLVSWKGYGSDDDTWEPEENIYFDPTEYQPIFEAIKKRKAGERKHKRSGIVKTGIVKPSKPPSKDREVILKSLQTKRESLETLSSELENETCEKVDKVVQNSQEGCIKCTRTTSEVNNNSLESHEKGSYEKFSKPMNNQVSQNIMLVETMKLHNFVDKSEKGSMKKFNTVPGSIKSSTKIEKLKNLKETLKSNLKQNLKFKDSWKKNSVIDSSSIFAEEVKPEKKASVKIYSRDFRKTGLEDYKIPKLGTAGKRRDSASSLSSDYKTLFLPKIPIKRPSIASIPSTPTTPATPNSPLFKNRWRLTQLDDVIQPIEPGSKSEMKILYEEQSQHYNRNFYMGMSSDIIEGLDEFEIYSDPTHRPVKIPLDLAIDEPLEEPLKDPSNSNEIDQSPLEVPSTNPEVVNSTPLDSHYIPTKSFVVPEIVVQEFSDIHVPTNMECDIFMSNNSIQETGFCMAREHVTPLDLLKKELAGLDMNILENIEEKMDKEVKMEICSPEIKNSINVEYLEEILKKIKQEPMTPTSPNLSHTTTNSSSAVSPTFSDDIIDIPDTPASPDPEPIEDDDDEPYECPSMIFPLRGQSRFELDESGKPKMETSLPPPSLVDFGWMEREQEEKFNKLINFLADDKVDEEEDDEETTMIVNGYKYDKIGTQWRRDRSYTMPYGQRQSSTSSSSSKHKLYKYGSDHRIYDKHRKRFCSKLRSPSRSSSSSSIKWHTTCSVDE